MIRDVNRPAFKHESDRSVSHRNENGESTLSNRLAEVMTVPLSGTFGEDVVKGAPIQPFLLTVPETAQLLRTSRKAIYLMAERGQLPGLTRIGRRLLFRRDDVIRWLDESRASSLKE